ncbi:MAG TPA: M23 family metallopeptidase [Bryobacteraceae bacterium]|nr:M23 family metallopeptidase [Bryobacteraceae bacterium]
MTILRSVLALLLVLLVGAIGYYFGTRSNAAPPGDSARIEHGTSAPPGTAERSRTEPSRGPALPAPPDIAAVPGKAAIPNEADTPVADSAPLENRRLELPVANMKPGDLQDMFYQPRGGGERRHEATDILAPRGTPVLAVESGIVQKLFESKAGGLTIYQYDGAQEYCFYYAHLDRYAEGLHEGQLVRRGDTIGYVGITGNADPSTPHLHFAIFKLGPAKKWWEGNQPVNPFPVLQAAMKPSGPASHQSTPRARSSR